MSTAESRAILLRADHGEAVKLTDCVDSLKICVKSGFDEVSAFLASTD